MGRARNKIARSTKNKASKKAHDTKRRPKDVDQIQDELRKVKDTGKEIEFELDEDIPGLGQHYCAICARHFINAENLATHIKSRAHKRRISDVNQKQYTQDEAEWASGRSKEILPPIGNNRR